MATPSERLRPQGFQVQLDNPEKIQRDLLYASYINDVQNGTGYRMLLGQTQSSGLFGELYVTGNIFDRSSLLVSLDASYCNRANQFWTESQRDTVGKFLSRYYGEKSIKEGKSDSNEYVLAVNDDQAGTGYIISFGWKNKQELIEYVLNEPSTEEAIKTEVRRKLELKQFIPVNQRLRIDMENVNESMGVPIDLQELRENGIFPRKMKGYSQFLERSIHGLAQAKRTEQSGVLVIKPAEDYDIRLPHFSQN